MICPIYLAHGLIRGPTEGNGEPAAGRGFGPGIPCSRGRTGALPRVAVAPVGTTTPIHPQPVTLPRRIPSPTKLRRSSPSTARRLVLSAFHSAYLFPACVAPFIACETAKSVFACPRSLLASLSFRYRWPHHRDLRAFHSYLHHRCEPRIIFHPLPNSSASSARIGGQALDSRTT